MTGKSHLPPVPPASRPPHGAPTPRPEGEAAPEANPAARTRDLDSRGREANVKANTRHPGHQQDR
jgi:hypothetical protein